MNQQVNKLNELTIDISPRNRTNITTNTTFFSMDVKTAKKIINFTVDGEPLDLTSATVLLGFEFADANSSKIMDSKDGSVVIENTEKGQCSIVLPNHLYAYSGRVYVHTYIMFDDGRSLDAGIIVTQFEESWLDRELEEMEAFYVKRFEGLAREIKAHASRLQDELNGLQKQADEIQNQIQTSELVTRAIHEAHLNNKDNPHEVIIDQIPSLQDELDRRSLTDHLHQNATGLADGFMSRSDKEKLDGITPATATPLPPGIATAGSGTLYARENHVHPPQTTVSGNAGTATVLQTGRQINGTNFNGSANITTANWGIARTMTIGNHAVSVNGSSNISATLAQIGAAPESHVNNHPLHNRPIQNITNWDFNPAFNAVINAAGRGEEVRIHGYENATNPPWSNQVVGFIRRQTNEAHWVVEVYRASDSPNQTDRIARRYFGGIGAGWWTAWIYDVTGRETHLSANHFVSSVPGGNYPNGRSVFFTNTNVTHGFPITMGIVETIRLDPTRVFQTFYEGSTALNPRIWVRNWRSDRTTNHGWSNWQRLASDTSFALPLTTDVPNQHARTKVAHIEANSDDILTYMFDKIKDDKDFQKFVVERRIKEQDETEEQKEKDDEKFV